MLSISLSMVFAVMSAGAFLALVGYLRFVVALRRHEPELWQRYRQLAFTLEPSYWQHPKLVAAVYSRISHPRVVAARRTDLRCKYVFAMTALFIALLFCAAHVMPALRAP